MLNDEEKVKANRREEMLFIIESKWRSLDRTVIKLDKLKSDLTSPVPVIETQRDSIEFEKQLLETKLARIDANLEFNFPDGDEIKALRQAISTLEKYVAQTSALEAVIVASNDVIATVPAGNI